MKILLPALLLLAFLSPASAFDDVDEASFKKDVAPFLKKFCFRCHNADNMKSGIRVDRLNGKLEDRNLKLWTHIRGQLKEETMPPEDELQPTAAERKQLIDWIGKALIVARSRPAEKNGSVRRLTVAQYRNTLRDLLGIEDDLTDVLPPDAVSKDGFLNNQQSMLLSPILVEAYFDIAEKALDRCIVDEDSIPAIQNFRMDLGAGVNPKPFPDKLILGALSMLLENQNFQVTELTPKKPFDFAPFRMRKKYRFIEGYQGNATVRGWREYDSIYHSVFACVRGNPGYPKGHPYNLVPEGLLLRPAIPSLELFGVESTYGPKANFKISLRELPDDGRFRVTVRAAKYDDALLLDQGTKAAPEPSPGAITIRDLSEPRTVEVEKPGIYQADVYLTAAKSVAPDGSKLQENLIAHWPFDGDAKPEKKRENKKAGTLTEGAKFVDSPFGKAVLFDGQKGSVVVPRDDSMNVGEGEFTVAAWIHPRGLRQAGIVARGSYGYTHGWVFDMPAGNGTLRIETANGDNQANGTVQSNPKAITNNRWNHVAVVVRRGDNATKLYVNGFEVGSGTINAANLDNPDLDLHIGRVPEANLFKGEIDEVHFFKRALGVAELKALIEPGSKFVQPPPSEMRKNLTLTLNGRALDRGAAWQSRSGRRIHSQRLQEAYMATRLEAGSLEIAAQYYGNAAVDRVVFTPLAEDSELVRRFAAFENRSPQLGVHVGLRRDCGSTLTQVQKPVSVRSSEIQDYIFEGAIANFPTPDVEKDNVNYLAGVREIGVRSEFTDGRDMPRLLIKSVEFEGPFYESWPPASHRSIFFESDMRNPDDPLPYARDVISRFASRAFRRPVTDAELTSLTAVFEGSFRDTGDLQASVKDALLVVLTSPQFLFLIEDSATPKPEPITDYELASKLSYFLWNAAPDRVLLARAEAGDLRKSLDSEVERLIADDRFDQFASEFAAQWLSLDKFDVVEVDRKQFPKLTRDARTQLRQEPVEFLKHLIRKNLSVRNLVQSDFIVANEIVASYYDLGENSESGFGFAALPHQSKHLGGVLTQASILSGLSNGRESNPVKRGAWLARKIIAEPPEDPPPNVPALPENEDQNLSLREKLEKHRNQEGCAKCHAGIDPWGVPFEQFDAGGLIKKKADIDASSTLPDETEVADLNGLKRYLAEDRIDQVAFSFLKHVATYATGRSLTYNEIEFLKEKAVELRATDYRAADLIRFVVKSPIFLEK